MRKFLAHLPVATLSLLVVGALFVPHTAHAVEALDALVDFFSFSSNIVYGLIGKLLWWVLIPITGMILNLVGLLVDSALILSLTREFYMSPAIVEGWSVIRDLCNILFIFILIFTGIKTILSLDTADTRRIVVSVIIGAILINFSLFLTRVAIDVSNIFTAWITQGIKDLGNSGGVSDATVAVLSMQKLAEQQKEFSVASFRNFGLSSFATGIALLALNCIAMYVLFKVAFLMFGRLVSFILLMITAPIGFVGHLVPKLEQYAKDWRDELTKACLMAPMFLLMLYITLFMATKFGDVLEKVAGQAVQGSTNDLLGSNFGIAQYSLFIIVAMLMLKSLKVAEEYTGAVAGQIGGVLKSATMLATGTMATRFIGGAASALQSSKFAKDLATSDKWLGRVAGRTIMEGSGMVAGAGFGAGEARTGLGLDKVGITKSAFKGAADGGRKGDIKAYTESEKKYAESFGDDSEGLRYRAKYASETRPDENSALYKLSTKYLGESADMKASSTVSKEANDAYRKAEVEGAKKDVATASNKIIEERMAIDALEQAAKSNEGAPEEQHKRMNVALDAEKERLAGMEQGLSRVDKKTYGHVSYKQHLLNQLDAQIASGEVKNDAATQKNRSTIVSEINSEIGTLPAEQQEKIRKGAKKVSDFLMYKAQTEQRINAIKKEQDVSKKKVAILRSRNGDTESIGDIIQSERIGLKPKPVVRYKVATDKDGNPRKNKNNKPIYEESDEGTYVRIYDKDGNQSFVTYDPKDHTYEKDRNGNTVFTDVKDSLSDDLMKKTREYNRKKETFDRMEGKGKKSGDKKKNDQIDNSNVESDEEDETEE